MLIEQRDAAGKAERLPGLAADLVQLKDDIIMTSGDSAAAAALKACLCQPGPHRTATPRPGPRRTPFMPATLLEHSR